MWRKISGKSQHGSLNNNCIFISFSQSIIISKTFSSSYYAAFDKKRNWSDALSFCQRFGADLVKIESQGETEFINATWLLSLEKMWIGLNDLEVEGDWKWSDGTGLGVYSNWGYRKPSNWQNQDFVIIKRGFMGADFFDAQWNDLNCGRPFFYLCEKKS